MLAVMMCDSMGFSSGLKWSFMNKPRWVQDTWCIPPTVNGADTDTDVCVWAAHGTSS